MSCIEAARSNARMVRTALTRETWECDERVLDRPEAAARPARCAAGPAERHRDDQSVAPVSSRAFHGTMLRNEIYNFSRIGTFNERADNTARILDVKYYVLLPSVSHSAPRSTISSGKSISALGLGHRAYGWVYDAVYNPANIADFLILNGQMPRSLHYCYEKIVANLSYLEREYKQRLDAHDTADATLRLLEKGSIKM